MNTEGNKNQVNTPSISFWAVIILAGVLMAVVYGLARTVLLFFAEYAWYEYVTAGALLLAELFIIVHGVGYLLNVLRMRAKGGQKDTLYELPENPPKVAVIVPAYKEDPSVLWKTLVSLINLSYENCDVYLLDDTPYDVPEKRPDNAEDYRRRIEEMCEELGVDLFRHRWRGAKAGMVNDFLAFMRGEPLDGSRLVHNCGEEHSVEADYLVIFDADQNPVSDFLEQPVAGMEAEPELAFIQTPQYYWNFEKNRVSRGAGLQQAVFYEYICEGKGEQNAMFCCGTNVIFRISALDEIGGLFEGSVTEDFATAFELHRRGWKSKYFKRVAAFGLGPEDLGGYFKQQFRWAYGTISTFKSIIAAFFQNPGALSPAMWWEYLLSSTYYLVGAVFLVLIASPIAFLLADVPSYFARPGIYAGVFVPYITIMLSIFFISLGRRGYSAKDIFLGQLLVVLCFPVHLLAAASALLGRRIGFVVTPKGISSGLSLRENWMQLFFLYLTLAAVVWGVNRAYYEPGGSWPVIINVIWCAYHFAILCSIFYFGNAAEDRT